jgi:hypothetical protein
MVSNLPAADTDTPLSVTQAAAILGITPRAVRHRIKTGTLAAAKLGDGATSAYWISRDEIDRVLTEALAGGQPPRPAADRSPVVVEAGRGPTGT